MRPLPTIRRITVPREAGPDPSGPLNGRLMQPPSSCLRHVDGSAASSGGAHSRPQAEGSNAGRPGRQLQAYKLALKMSQ